MNIFKHIQDETLQSQEEIFQHKYSNNILEYQSFLRGFNKNLFSLFKSHYEALDVMKSIKSLCFNILDILSIKMYIYS